MHQAMNRLPSIPLLLAPALLSVLPVRGSAAEPALLPTRAPPVAYEQGFRSVADAQLRAWIGFLASPECEGRESGTRGYDIAARYVASIFEEMRLVPGGDPVLGGARSWFQEFTLVRRKWDLEKAVLEIGAGSGGGTAEVIPLSGKVRVRSRRAIEWTGPWVFVGRGEGAESDAPDDFRGVDVEKSVVVVLPREAETRRTTDMMRGAIAAGARRIVIISDRAAGSRDSPDPPELPEDQVAKHEASGPPEVVYLPRVMLERMLAGTGAGIDEVLPRGPARSRAFQGRSLRLHIPFTETRRGTRNVVAWAPGSDPDRTREVVLVTAHLDHMGIDGNKVFRGADDDASGVAAVLGVARAFATNPTRPRRSILFACFAAEEKGLIGSEHFAARLGFPVERIVLALQLDMVGRDEERPPAELARDNAHSIHVVGSKRHSRELDPWVLAANDLVGLALEYDEERVYERSDHYVFGRRGVPVALFFSGFHADYHGVGDVPEKINYGKVAAVTRLVFALAYEVADRERRLSINRL